jgi:TRAP-type C4-dicarboxylate transport system substrate-binding protein
MMRDFGATAVFATYLWALVRPRVKSQWHDPPLRNGKFMFKALARCALLSLALLPCAATAEPITLKLAFFSSDREGNYLEAVKPFVDAINASGVIHIDVYLSGALGKSYPGQAQLVLDGGADFAFVNPGLTPELFPDNTAIALPGLFRDAREATLVYTRMVASGALKGYEEFFVVAALGTGPLSIHTRLPAVSLKDLKGKKIRAINPTEVAALKALDIAPEVLPINQTAEAISTGKIDGSTAEPQALVEFGIARVTSHHYMLRLGTAPLSILMNRKKFDSLPNTAQDLIRRYSGEWLAARYIEAYDANANPIVEQLKSDPKRTVTAPSQADLDTAQVTFKTVIREWQAKSPHNLKLFMAVEAEIEKLRLTR